MKFFKCYYFEPVNVMCHGAEKVFEDGKTKIVEAKEEIFICLDSGIVVEKLDNSVSLRHISSQNGAYSEIRLFVDNKKEYSIEDIIGSKQQESTSKRKKSNI